MNSTQKPLSESTVQPDDFAKKRKRAWSVTAVGVLLILQAIVMFMIFPVLVAFEIDQMPDAQLLWLINENGGLAQVRIEVVDWSKLEFLLDFTRMRVPVPSRVITSLAFLALAMPVLITGFLFLRLWRHAWTLAVFFEGAILAIALYVYFNFRHPYIYLLMISGIFMVFYLNYFEVQLAFQRYIRPLKK